MAKIEAVICDFGGVLTRPLADAFVAMEERSGVSSAFIGRAMQRIIERGGPHPLFELECGRIAEADFLADVGEEIAAELGRPFSMASFGADYFSELHPNDDFLAYVDELNARGVRLAVLTNNVREWQPLWRGPLGIDDRFELVVDSGFVGMRKPDPGIYELTLRELGLPAEACAFVDDFEINIKAANDLGIAGVWFQETQQAIDEIEGLLRA
jgi:putative hydrolase of the HAD superfamily